MELIVAKGLDGGFEPRVLELLNELPPDLLFYQAQNLRHPAAIYYLSLQKVAGAFTKVAEEYYRKRNEYLRFDGRDKRRAVGVNLDDLINLQEQLLRALQEHLDDCFLILKTFTDPKKATVSNIFTDRYVVDNKLPGARSFAEAVNPIKRNLRIANKLKHQQGRLQGILAMPNAHLGYYLETPGLGGALGPDREIHPRQGCISFARDLAVRLCDVYRVAASLEIALGKIRANNRRKYSEELRGRPESIWISAVELATRLPAVVYPGEVLSGTPSFRYKDSNALFLKFPDPRVVGIMGD